MKLLENCLSIGVHTSFILIDGIHLKDENINTVLRQFAKLTIFPRSRVLTLRTVDSRSALSEFSQLVFILRLL